MGIYVGVPIHLFHYINKIYTCIKSQGPQNHFLFRYIHVSFFFFKSLMCTISPKHSDAPIISMTGICPFMWYIIKLLTHDADSDQTVTSYGKPSRP